MNLSAEAHLVGKVLDLQDVKTIRCRAFLPPMPGPWQIVASPLPVYSSGKKIGFALTRLIRSYIGVEVELFLAGDTPERLDLELGKPLFVKPYHTANLYGLTPSGSLGAKCLGQQLSSLCVTSEEAPGAGRVETGPYLEEE